MRKLLVKAILGVLTLAAPSALGAEAIQRDYDVVFATRGGRKLRLDFCRPEGDGPFPLVVCVHGGGWVKGHHHGFRKQIAWLAENGYAAATVEYRLAPKDKFPAQVHDVKAAVRFLRANAVRLRIDPERVGAWGASAGGYLVAMVGLAGPRDGLEGNGPHLDQSSRVQAVVNWFGGLDFRTIRNSAVGTLALKLGFNGRDINGLMRDFLGTDDRAAEVVRQASPAVYADPQDPPILTVQGERDVLVPVAEARRFHQALKHAGADSTLVVYPRAGHGFGGPVGRQARALLLEFFGKHLKAGPATP